MAFGLSTSQIWVLPFSLISHNAGFYIFTWIRTSDSIQSHSAAAKLVGNINDSDPDGLYGRGRMPAPGMSFLYVAGSSSC